LIAVLLLVLGVTLIYLAARRAREKRPVSGLPGDR
jgi:cytochrome c-type biogenesis protein CcmH/NrfF